MPCVPEVGEQATGGCWSPPAWTQTATNTGADPSRESPLTGTADIEALEDPDSPGQGSSLSTWPSPDSNEKSEATRICQLSLAVLGAIIFHA